MPWVRVATIGHEFEVTPDGHRMAVEKERGDLGVMAGALAVERAVGAVGSHHQRATVDGHRVGPGDRGGGRWERAGTWRVGARRHELEGLKQRLIVLRLVLGHHVPHETAASEIGGIVGEVGTRENGKGTLAGAAHVFARLLGVEDADLTAHGARGREGIVGVGHVRVERRGLLQARHQPQFLVRGDVCHVPCRRTHNRVGAARNPFRIERLQNGERVLSNSLKALCDGIRGRSHAGIMHTVDPQVM